ncbi:ferritin-like domain-containing protein [Archangium violaceum]|uniref:hypothetical protein n=1 Tax=Archangium violaceum TaxID=83451 RepID=UPI002B292445|nr:ferritin-like domain-containing protein [Archangium violaceum]
MAPHVLPVPSVARPLAPVDPYRHREAYARVLSMLCHAEAAALEGFKLLTHPDFVQTHAMFAKARRFLVQDESRHLEDLKQLVRKLGYDDVLPPSPEEAEFWSAWRSGRLFALPFKPSVAALFCLLSEGLGYAFLYNLAQATRAPDIRAVLEANLEDEKSHLQLSLVMLERALVNDRTFLADVLIYLYGYSLLARRPIRRQRKTLEAIGLDFYVIFGSSIRFVFDLLKLVLAETGRYSPLWGVLDSFTQGLGRAPRFMKLLHLFMFLPEPPFSRWFVYQWGRLTLRLSPQGQSSPAGERPPPAPSLAALVRA